MQFVQKSKKAWKHWLIIAFLAPTLAMLQNCASGGYKLTRQYSGWVNRQPVILRVVLYILTSVVYSVTLLVDMVLFNTMDFWEGRVSQGTFQWEKNGLRYVAHHQIENGLKKSTIQAFRDSSLIEELIIQENSRGEILVSKNGSLLAFAHDFDQNPTLSIWDGPAPVKKVSLLSNISTIASR